MEKEILSGFDVDDLSGGSTMSSTNLEDVKEEERRLKRDSTMFTVVGLSVMVTGGLLFAITNFGLGLQGMIPWLAGLGIVGMGVGLIKILKNVFKKDTIDFPSLKLRRKSMRSGTERASERPFKETGYMRKKLSKSNTNRVFFGVAGGLAEYAGISPVLMRLVFILAFFASMGAITLPYVILAVIMPMVRRLDRRDSKLRGRGR